MPSGLASPRHRTRGENSFSKDSSPCVVSLSSPCSQSSSVNWCPPPRGITQSSCPSRSTSLCRPAQVSKRWKGLADDDLWRGICEQHNGQKCLNCGWGLPILERKHTVRFDSSPPSSFTPSSHSEPSSPPRSKRELDLSEFVSSRPMKRLKAEFEAHAQSHSYDNLLVLDTTVKVWNFRTGEAFTLRGHRD
jgi:hypothetical protein